MGGIHFPITGDNTGFMNAIKDVQSEINKTSDIVKQNGGDIDGIIEKITSGLAKLGVAFSAQQLVSQIMKVRGEFQQLEVAFTTMLGSAEKADALMAQLTRTAAITPFGLQDVSNGAKQLLAYGISADKVNDILIRLGDIAAGLSIPLGDLVSLYGTTMTQGRMFTMDLRQFMGRGIPMAEELAKIFGVAKEEVSGLVTAGKVTSDVFAQAINNMTSSGSKFGGLMEAQSKTITGQISNIEDAIDVMFNKLGQSSEGVINAGLKGVSLLVENYEKVGEAIAVVITAYGAEKAAIVINNAIKARESALIKQIALEKALATKAGLIYTDAQIAEAAKTKLNTIAQQGLVKSLKAVASATMLNPYVAIGAAVAALGFAIYKAATYQSDYEKSQRKLNEALAEAQKEYTKEITKLDRLKGKLKGAKEGTEDYEQAKKDLVALASSYDQKLAQEIERLGLTEEAYKKLNIAIQNNINAKIKNKRQDEIDDTYATDYEKYMNKLSKQFEKSFGVEKGAEQFQRFKTLFANRQDLEILKVTATRGGRRAMRKELGVSSEKDGEIDEILKGWRQALYNTGDYKKLTGIIGDLIDARNQFKKNSEDLERKFGEIGKPTGNQENKGEDVRKTQNKEYWEKLKKEAEDELAALDVSLLNSEKALELRKKISEYESKIALYDIKKNKDVKKLADKKNKDVKKLADKKKDIISTLLEKNEDERISLLEEGYEKTIKTIENSYNEAISTIDKKAGELKAINKENGLGEILTPEEQVLIDTSKSLAKSKRDKDISDVYKGLADKYKSFDQKRRDIDERYQEDMAIYTVELNRLLSLGLDTTNIEASMGQRDKAYKEEITSLNDEIVNQMESTALWGKLFSDTSKKNVASLKSLVKEIKVLLDYLAGVSKVKPVGFTDEQLQALGGNVENIKLIFEQYNNAVDELDKKTSYPFDSLIKGFKKLSNSAKTAEKATEATNKATKESLEKQSKEEKESGLSYLQQGVGEVANAFSSATDIVAKFADVLPNDKLKETAEQIGALSSTINSIAEGAASGGWIGAIVSGVTNIISQTIDVFVQAAAEEEEFLQNSKDFARAYDLLMLKLKDEDYDGIFGTSSINKAIDAYSKSTIALEKYSDAVNEKIELNFAVKLLGKVFNPADYEKFSNEIKMQIKAYNEGATALQGMMVKTNDYSGWANFWGKEDEYTYLKDLAPGLWGENGEFDIEVAKEFLATNTQITAEQRSQIENVINLKEAYNEAIAVIDEELNRIFGHLSGDLTNIIFDSIRNGTDAWSEFEKAGASIIDSLGKQMLQELYIGEYFEQYRQQLRDAYAQEDPMTVLAKVTSDMMNGAKDMIPVWQRVATDWDNMAKEQGYAAGSTTEDQASKRGFTGMSQETGSELNGRFTALQISGEEIKNQMFNVVFKLDAMISITTSGNSILSDIREAHAMTNNHLEDMIKIFNVMKTHTAYLETINNNLK